MLFEPSSVKTGARAGRFHDSPDGAVGDLSMQWPPPGDQRSGIVAGMAPFAERVTLGRTGLSVSPLGIAGGYGVDEASLLAAFDRGVNYWYHGSMRRPGMTAAIHTLVGAGKRDQLVLLLQSYSRVGWLLERTFTAGLKRLGTDYADVLLLGMFNNGVPAGVLDRAERLRERGLVRHLAISAHRRAAYADYAADPRYGVMHIRYSAAHPGAERDVFPLLPAEGRPGTVCYTATSWGRLLKPKYLPQGEQPVRGRDCYRFVLSNPDFNVCMTGPANAAELQEALASLGEGPLTPEEEVRLRAIGGRVHG
jgi:aryl-alcohol dehydrogenase-like predicted oxidoreductase